MRPAAAEVAELAEASPQSSAGGARMRSVAVRSSTTCILRAKCAKCTGQAGESSEKDATGAQLQQMALRRGTRAGFQRRTSGASGGPKRRQASGSGRATGGPSSLAPGSGVCRCSVTAIGGAGEAALLTTRSWWPPDPTARAPARGASPFPTGHSDELVARPTRAARGPSHRAASGAEQGKRRGGRGVYSTGNEARSISRLQLDVTLDLG